MARTSDKRERLVTAAKDLIHRKGFNQTTLADIAQESGVPLGNVYYYFKSKDEIAATVIEERIEDFRAGTKEWEQEPDPRKRLEAFLDMVKGVSVVMAEHGCPVGSLSQELCRGETPLAYQANALLKAYVEWATEQFRLMGKEEAAELGLHFIATMQGVALMANAFNDPDLVARQISRQKKWLRSL